MIVTIEVKDLASKDLLRIQQRIMPALREATRQSLDAVARRAKGYAPLRSGKLRRSIEPSRPRIVGNRVRAQIPARPRAKGSHWFIGRFHEKGAVIRPKKATGWLAIPHPDGTVRFVKRVVLPPKPWLWPAWARSVDGIKRIFKNLIMRMVK